MKFSEVKKQIEACDQKRIPKDLHELILCEKLARYIGEKTNISYDDITKDRDLEDQGIDSTIHGSDGSAINIQVTHCRDYNMNPCVEIEYVNTSGQPIKEAADEKCKMYCERKVDTKQTILLIEGATVGTFVDDLANDLLFLKFFQELSCFKEIYYAHHFNGGFVYPIKVDWPLKQSRL